MENCMIDIETLSTQNDAAILSIGACYFDITTGDIGKEFYTKVNLCDAISKGRVDGGTFSWWLQQNEAARAELTKKCDIPLITALVNLKKFLSDDPCVWSNGATFDIVILDTAYKKSQKNSPWKHWNVRDVRTILSLARAKDTSFEKGTFDGTEHNALDDAIYQSKYVAKAYRSLMFGEAKPSMVGSSA